MKTSNALLEALTDSVVEALKLRKESPERRERIRSALDAKLRRYRVKADDFAGDPGHATRFADLRRPNAPAIRIRLVRLGWSQAYAAKHFGISDAAVSKSLNADAWSFDRFLKWADLLGCEVDAIVLPADGNQADQIVRAARE